MHNYANASHNRTNADTKPNAENVLLESMFSPGGQESPVWHLLGDFKIEVFADVALHHLPPILAASFGYSALGDAPRMISIE